MKLYKKRRRDWSHHRQWRLVGRCSHSRFVALTNRIESRHPISSRKFKFKKREKMPSETRKLGLPPRASLPSSFRTGKMTIKSESFFVANHFVIELYFLFFELAFQFCVTTTTKLQKPIFSFWNRPSCHYISFELFMFPTISLDLKIPKKLFTPTPSILTFRRN